jgi:ribosomal protein L13
LKTYSTKTADIERQWHVIDASGKTLGKLATQVAGLLMGKHKPIFSPNLDTGDFVTMRIRFGLPVTRKSKSSTIDIPVIPVD